MDDTFYAESALTAAVASARVNAYCDRAEHCEPVDKESVLQAAKEFRKLAQSLAKANGLNIFHHYAKRLAEIELRNVFHTDYTLSEMAWETTTWRGLQHVQALHDQTFHPDVTGLAKIDQLRHYAFHTAKLAGALAEVAQDHGKLDDFIQKRLADFLLFGIKLSTVMGEKLPEDDLTERA